MKTDDVKNCLSLSFLFLEQTSFRLWKNLDLLPRYFDRPHKTVLLQKLRSIRKSMFVGLSLTNFEKFPIF